MRLLRIKPPHRYMVQGFSYALVSDAGLLSKVDIILLS